MTAACNEDRRRTPVGRIDGDRHTIGATLRAASAGSRSPSSTRCAAGSGRGRRGLGCRGGRRHGAMFARRDGQHDVPPIAMGGISTPSRPAAGSTACWACSLRSKRCALVEADMRPTRRSRWSAGREEGSRSRRRRSAPACSAPSLTGRERAEAAPACGSVSALADRLSRGAACGSHPLSAFFEARHQSRARSSGRSKRLASSRRAEPPLVRASWARRRIPALRRCVCAECALGAARSRSHRCDRARIRRWRSRPSACSRSSPIRAMWSRATCSSPSTCVHWRR